MTVGGNRLVAISWV